MNTWCSLIPLWLGSIELLHLLTHFTNKDDSSLFFSIRVWTLVSHLSWLGPWVP